MKKIISLICVILLCFSVLTVTACKDDEEIIKFEKTVEANQPISVASLLAESDTIYTVSLFDANGNEISIDYTKITFKKGEYKLKHADGQVSKITAVDTTAPEIRYDFNGFNPTVQTAITLPFSAVDNCDGKLLVITENKNANNLVLTSDGLNLVIKATDLSGNQAQVQFNLLKKGTSVTLNKSLFDGLDQNKTYSCTYKITEINGEQKTTYVGSSLTVQGNKYYVVNATAKSGQEVHKTQIIYYPF